MRLSQAAPYRVRRMACCPNWGQAAGALHFSSRSARGRLSSPVVGYYALTIELTRIIRGQPDHRLLHHFRLD